MKYFFLLFLLLIGAIAYIRFEQPHVWNGYVNALKAPEEVPASNQARIPAPPSVSEIISPNSTNFINPEHVKPVEQSAPPQAPNPSH